jgi:hypothetical protein
MGFIRGVARLIAINIVLTAAIIAAGHAFFYFVG